MSNIVVPQLGESVVEARVGRWLKQVGETVGAGEPVVELETDKIDLEVGSDQAGVLARIDHKEGDDVKVGEVLGVVDGAAESEQSVAKETRQEPRTPPTLAPEPSPRREPGAGSRESASEAESRATATARRIAEEHKVDLARVSGSGDGGRITKDDVQRFISSASQPAGSPAPSPVGQGFSPAAPAPAARPAAPPTPAPAPVPRRAPGERTEERQRMSKRRATIAKRLVEAQRTAAMLTTFNEVDMSAIMALRGRRKESFQKQHGVGLGLSSFFVKASVAALRAFPRLNAEIEGDEIVYKHYYDIGIAVGAEGGLVVPVLRDADRMSFPEIEQTVRDFAKRADEGTLTLEDLKGGTFTLTNGGVFGSLMSTPILNPPQVGILGLHKIEERPIAVGGQVVVKPMMYVALSYDHRIVDGREAVQFLVRIKELIEDPGGMLIEL
jgi:2-oxoglutarate dehydrogenase E2 component (dihydrolipoamide succinyltransferase)